jgi:putative intracellular protease/amidase
MKPRAHLGLYDGAAEMEVGHLLAELHTGRFTATSFELVTVAESPDPITSMGGIRMVPDALLADLEPAGSDLLILPGAEMWDAGGGEAFAAAAGRFLDAGVPVAAICGATAGLARAGLLDTRKHTSNAPEYLAMTGYAGGDHRPAVSGAVRASNAGTPRIGIRAHPGRLRGPLRPWRPGGVPDLDGGAGRRPRTRFMSTHVSRIGSVIERLGEPSEADV